MSSAEWQARRDEVDNALQKAFDEYEAGRPPNWESLRGLPGVALEPTPWEDAAAAARSGTVEALSTLGRSPLSTRDYWAYSEGVIRAKYASVTDYLRIKVFGMQAQEGADGKLAAVVPEGFYDRQCIVWRDNDFPYYLEEGVEHHNLWTAQPLTLEELEAEVASRRQGYEWACFINPPVLMSVPSMWHAHILSRRKR